MVTFVRAFTSGKEVAEEQPYQVESSVVTFVRAFTSGKEVAEEQPDQVPASEVTFVRAFTSGKEVAEEQSPHENVILLKLLDNMFTSGKL